MELTAKSKWTSRFVSNISICGRECSKTNDPIDRIDNVCLVVFFLSLSTCLLSRLFAVYSHFFFHFYRYKSKKLILNLMEICKVKLKRWFPLSLPICPSVSLSYIFFNDLMCGFPLIFLNTLTWFTTFICKLPDSLTALKKTAPLFRFILTTRVISINWLRSIFTSIYTLVCVCVVHSFC